MNGSNCNQAINVSFTESKLVVYLVDGRELHVPLCWFPRLNSATKEQQNQWRLIGNGLGIHWESADEDISVSGLLRGERAPD
ncbi:MAG: DUF2442 domain-containing protein [Verrucomicrobiota bacterium]